VALPQVADKGAAARILEALNRPEGPKDSYEIQQWRLLSEANDIRVRFDVRKYLYDKRDGKAVQPVDFGDKPISVTVDIASAVTERASKK
jgi:hypothetical protein